MTWYAVFARLLAVLATARAFNIDMAHPLTRSGARNSYFGFSVAAHFANESPTLLVGAPRAESGQPGTRQAGAIFACSLDFARADTPADCAQLQVEYATDAEFHRPPQRLNSKHLHSEGKNQQLLGFVVASSGEKRGGQAMACAPLLRYGANAYTDGACYLLSSELNHTGVISTCNSLPKKDRHNDYGACQQGFSAMIDQNIILTGLPGARKWTGGVFGRYEFLANGFPDTVEHWTMEVNKEQAGIINVLTSHDYLGYSVAHGRFGFWYEGASADDASFTIVSGATRFQQTGGVVFLPFRRHASADEQRLLGLDDNFTIAGSLQLGAGFGASLLVLDLNADGYDDLIVGAPYEFQRDEDVERGGAVYVYYASGVRRARGENDLVFHAPIVLRAGGAHSQFGYALTALGNIDNDPNGYQDFAVGAPQEDDGRGAVFIFYGAQRNACSTEPAQVLRAKDLPYQIGAAKPPLAKIGKPARQFGAALAGGIDLDGNGYGDLLVGAFVSDTVFLFRTRPVIDVTLEHVFPQKYIKIDDRRLAACPTNARNCFTVTTTLLVADRNNTGVALMALERDGAGQPLVCRLEMIPYAKGVAPRGIFIDRNRTATSWPCGGGDATRRPQERVHQLYMPQSNQDWTNPLRFNFTVEMRERPRMATGASPPPLPVVNARQSRHVFDAAFDKKCGDDNDCHTDLALTAILLNITRRDDGAYVTKVTERDAIVARFVIENRGERAFYARLYVRYNADELDEPQRLTPAGNGNGNGGVSAVDVERKESGFTVLALGNPLEESRKVSVDLRFNLVRASTERVSALLAFTAHVNSTSIESSPNDNEWTAEVKLIKEADLQLDGVSRPSIVRFSNGQPAAVDEVDIGPEVVHVYTLTNHGPFYARNVTVTINWPLRLNSERAADDWALYTLEEPVVRHQNGKTRRCTPLPAGAINPLNVYNDETLRLTYQRPRVKRDVAEPVPDVTAEPLGLWALIKAYWWAAVTSDGVSPSAAKASIFGGRFLKPTNVQERSGSQVRIGDVNCRDATALCVRLTCNFDYVGTDDSASIEIRARLWNFTFANDYKSIEYFSLTSDAFVEMDPAQGILEDVENNFARVATHAYPDRPAQDDRLAWWMLVLAALVGLLLLGVMILVCRRCGFFRRRKDDLRLMHTALYRRENDEFFGN